MAIRSRPNITNYDIPLNACVALLCVASIVAAAQVRVVDATDLKPLAGAYVFDTGGRLVGFSDENGVVDDDLDGLKLTDFNTF